MKISRDRLSSPAAREETAVWYSVRPACDRLTRAVSMCNRWRRKLVVVLCLVYAGFAQAVDLRIAYNSDWYPYSYGEADKVDGILVELLDHILAERLDYSLSHTGYPWSRVQLYVEKGREQAFFTYPSEQRLAYTDRADSEVFKVESRIFVKKDTPVANALGSNPEILGLDGARVCVMLGDNWSENFYRERGIAFDYGRDTLNCLERVAHDRSDLFLHATASSLAHLNQAGIRDRVAMLPWVYASVPLTLMVSKQPGVPPDLLRRFDEAVRRMEADGSLQALIQQLLHRDWPAPEASQ